MWFAIGVLCLVLYMCCSAWFLLGSSLQLHLMWNAKRKKPAMNDPDDVAGGGPSKYFASKVSLTAALPAVTIQAPVYNERYVIVRLLEALSELDYPRELLDIQVLDDSTDDTSGLIQAKVNSLKEKGINITVLRRTDRKGYKAGALQAALPFCRGQLIAIFDADFIPEKDFLLRMTAYFTDPSVGGVQGRWIHLNLNENALTRIQAFLLDSHFHLEQSGRSTAGYFLNFNGTAGMWRKSCIIDCGGWNGSVLTEDLELSYRAQLRGWQLRYDNNITVPAELPAEINAFKTQQFRWAKGIAQTAVRHLRRVWQLPIMTMKKIHATYHLLSSFSFLAVMGNAILTIPILAGRHYLEGFNELTNIALLTGITLPALAIYYYNGTRSTLPAAFFWKNFPAFLIIFMALSVQNCVAVIQGLFGRPSPFVRTPKLSGNQIGAGSYSHHAWTGLNRFELGMAVYLGIATGLSIYWKDYFLLLFLLMMLTGIIILLWPALKRLMATYYHLLVTPGQFPWPRGSRN